MEKLAENIKNAIIRNNPTFSAEQAETMKFGIECFISEVSKLTAYFVIFSMFSLTLHYLIAVLFFMFSRLFAGGFHANTYIQCFLISLSILSTGIILGSKIGLPLNLRTFLLVLSILLACIFAPVDHPNKPIINMKRRLVFKYLSVITFIILAGSTYVMKSDLASTASMVLFLEGLLLPAGYIFNGRSMAVEYENNK